MSFFDRNKINQKAEQNIQAEMERLNEEARERIEAALWKKREQEEKSLVRGFVNDALNEFPEIALSAGTRSVQRRIPGQMWIPYDMWEINTGVSMLNGVTYETFYIDKKGKTFVNRGTKDKYRIVFKWPRKEVVEAITQQILDSYFNESTISRNNGPFLEYPPITREVAKEIVEKHFMAYL